MNEFVESNDHVVDALAYRKALIWWGQENFRAFPWRLTTNPYYILISEVMLHRTQATQVIPVYERFIKRYPGVVALSKAAREDLHDILYSLGLRWRIDLIFEMATELMEQFGGQIPESKEQLLSLSGVSDYIAGAVLCFAWNLPESLADTNTIRVIGRVFGLEVKDSSRRNRTFKRLLARLVPQDQPRAYNYALLDLADKVCMKKQAPLCEQCPLVQWCMYARQNGRYMA